MLVRRLDEVLARTDPFDLAQGIDRFAQTLSDEQICALIDNAMPRLNDYYRDLFAPIARGMNGAPLRAPFAHALKSNLRVLPFFGTRTCERVLQHVPGDRTVAFGEERRRRPALVAAGVIAAMFALAAVAGGHYVSNARAVEYPSAAPVQNELAGISVPMHARAMTSRRVVAVTQRVPRPQAELQPAQAPTAAPPPSAAPPVAPPPQSRPRPQPPPAAVQSAARVLRAQMQPVAHGAAVIAVPRPSLTPVDPSNQSDLADVSDMPDAYSNATPLPEVTTQPAQAPAHVRAATPKPEKKSWLKSTVLHFDPFKPHP